MVEHHLNRLMIRVSYFIVYPIKPRIRTIFNTTPFLVTIYTIIFDKVLNYQNSIKQPNLRETNDGKKRIKY